MNNVPEIKLYRIKDEKIFQRKDLHAIFIGNGAIENGWEPVRKVLCNNPLFSDCAYKTVTVPEIELAIAATLGKLYFKLKDYDVKEGDKALRDTYFNLKNQLASEFKNASLSIKSNLYFSSFDDIEWDRTILVTTNWDDLLWKDGRIKNLIQLHGVCDYFKSLVLPTEFTIDIQETWECSKAWLTAHDKVVDLLVNSTHLTFWGIAFHTYDVELISFLALKTRENKKLNNITLINLVKNKDEVEGRLKSILQKNDVPITYVGM